MQKDWSGVVQAFNEARRRHVVNPFVTAMAWLSAMSPQSGIDGERWQRENRRELEPAYPWAARILAAANDPLTRIGGALLFGNVAGLWDEAFQIVEQILSSDEETRKSVDDMRVFLVEAAAAGQVDRALTLLEGSPARPIFELFIIALSQISGRLVHAPPEVLEVVSDLVRLIGQRREEREKESAEKAHASLGHSNVGAKRRRAGKGRAAAEN
ncbi:hypothetical protein WMF30_36570 [Sorangium sp. So ce134]